MDTAGIFHNAESGYTDLWEVTWERIDIFLPNLKQELFRGTSSLVENTFANFIMLETQQPEHLMPPAIPELRDSERMGQPSVLPPSVTSHSVLSLNAVPTPSPMDSVGATIGIAANPLYSPSVSVPSPPTSLPCPVVSPVAAPSVAPRVAEQNPIIAVGAESLRMQPMTSINPASDNSLLNPPQIASPSQNSGLLFDPSIIGGSQIPNVPVISPVPPIQPETSSAGDISAAANLTRSDSLAAVIADLNKTLQKTTVGNDTIG